MNGVQQVERFTAVRRAELKIADLELLLMTLADEIVRDREQLDKQHQDLIDGVNAAIRAALQAERADREQLAHDLDHRIGLVARTLTRVEQRTFWQRLRWIVRGI